MTASRAFSNAELAFAAYAALQPGLTSDQIAALQRDDVGMSVTQAQDFARRYPEIIAQLNDATSGLSLTAFRHTSGAIALAIRGTDEMLSDWFATNPNVAINGAGYQQIAALYNAWQRLTHRLGDPITVYRVELSDVANPVIAETVANNVGSAEAPLISSGAAVEVAGHSLGGHLALAFAGLFPINASQVYAFNAPGFKDSTLNRNFFARLGGQLPIGASPGGVSVLNVIADAQPGAGESFTLPAGLHSRPGMPLNVAIENQAAPTDEPNPPTGVWNHSQMVLADSLAVLSLLTNLAPTLSAADYEAILHQSAHGTAASYERVVDALETLLGIDNSYLPSGNNRRDDLYRAIYGVSSHPTYRMLSGTASLRPTAIEGAGALANQAKMDFGHFLAVQYLLPFTIEGVSNQIVNAHSDSYARWAADRAKRLAGEAALEFTDAYLADRAQMLAFLNTANSNDTSAFASNQISDQVLYTDLVKRAAAGSVEGKPTELNVFMVGGTPNPRGPNTRVVGFGTDGIDVLEGRDNRDRLYGGKGADRLRGGKDNDYLEGGEGLDVYAYSAGTSWNDGDDEIRDTDGQGVILYTFTGSGTAGTSNRVIGGEGIELDDTHWKSADGKYSFEREGADLRVRIVGDAGGSLLIRGFDFAAAAEEGSFGIRLVDAPTTPTSALGFEGDLRFLGSYYFVDPETGFAEWRGPDEILYDEFGNVLRDPGLVLQGADDVFHGSPYNDAMYGRDGRDRLFGEDGADLLFGGTGYDFIEGGEGDDVISGHDTVSTSMPFYDALHGGGGNDQIFAGAPQPLDEAWQTADQIPQPWGETNAGSSISGDAGDDILVGSVFPDSISGGSGDDLIIGGASLDSLSGDDGNDVLYAGAGGASMGGGMGDDILIAGDDSEFGSALAGGPSDYAPGDGDDLLIGSSRGDGFAGGDGSDLVLAGGGNDSFSDGYWAYFAPDTLYMGDGDDSVVASHGDDFIDGGAGNDGLIGNGGDDVIYGGSGNDRLYGGWGQVAVIGSGISGTLTFVDIESGDDALYGEEGDDVLDGDRGNDLLVGDVGNDYLRANLGNDLLDGGAGNDTLDGGPGGDTYLIDANDGIDTIFDVEAGMAGDDMIVFGQGVAPEDLMLLRSSADIKLFILFSGSDARIEIPWWYDDDGEGSEDFKIEAFVFADGQVWDPAEIESHVVVATGPTSARDQLSGTAGDDVIHALEGADKIDDAAGNDILFGDEQGDRITDSGGHNLLAGGDGDDFLRLNGVPIYDDEGQEIGLAGGSPGSIAIGGSGSDSVLIDDHSLVAYNAGDSEDTVRWTAGDIDLLTISLGDGISANDISISRDDFRLLVSFGPEIPPNEDGDPVPQEAIGLPNLLAGPEVWPALVLQVIGEDVRTYDLDRVVETYYADLAHDPGLTRWAAGEALQRNLLDISTTHAMGGAIAYQYATTGSVEGLTPEQIRGVLIGADFGLAPQPIAPSASNSAPLVSNAIVDLLATEDATVAFAFAADAFTDPDTGDVLTYSATLGDGSVLPAWLSFDAGTRTFSGTPLQAAVGALDVTVTATDAGGLSASDTFTLTVENVNDVPVVANPLTDLSFEAGAPFSFEVPASAFADEDPTDALALTVTRFDGSPLPAWLSFDLATALFTGNPAATDVGISHILVAAVDVSGASAQFDFGLVVRLPAGAEATGSAGDDVIYGGMGDETLTAKGGSDYLYGDVGNDLLKGGGGNDVLQGGAGGDVLRGGKGQNVLDGGAGDDLIFGGAGSAFIAGGAGNDTLRVGSGSDVIAFNAGDGMDTVYGGRDGGNTLSFGGGIRYSDLALSKVGKDLVVSAGAGEGVTLKNWYAGNHSVLNLQIVLDATEEFDANSADPLYNRRVQTFDFLGMVSAYDAARAATPGLTSWEITNALLAFHLSGADDMALGGDLAYWYGKNRTLSGISLQSAQQVIGAANFGSEAQSLRPFSGLQEGFVKLA